MVAIHTSEDIIRALREDSELLDQVRRAVMTDEVLALPGQFAEMQKTQNEMQKTQSEMLKTQNEMLKTQNKLLEGQSEIREDIRALHRMYRRQHDDLGRFRGNYAGDAGRRSGPEIAHLFTRLHDLRRIFVRPLSIEERGEVMGRASEVGISECSGKGVDYIPDSRLYGRSLRPDESRCSAILHCYGSVIYWEFGGCAAGDRPCQDNTTRERPGHLCRSSGGEGGAEHREQYIL